MIARLETRPAVQASKKRRGWTWVGKGLGFLVLVAFTLAVVYPLVVVIFGSFKSTYEFDANPWGLPASWTFDNYVFAWTASAIPRFFVNSVIVSGSTVLLTLALSSCAAYAFSTFRFPGGRALYLMFVLLLVIPVPSSFIPLYVILVRLHLVDTYLAVIIPYTVGSLPLSIFLMRAFFDAIPQDLSDAARMDGCSHFAAFVRIILPISRPGLATVAILTFLSAWNEFFLALVFLHNQDLFTLPLGLQSFSYQYRTDYIHVFAALVMSIIPIVVVYVAMQRQFIAGLTAGAVRG